MNLVQSMETILKSLGRDFVNLGEKGFVYGSQGKMLRRNIESLWFDNCVTARPYNIFLTPSSDQLADTLRSMRETTSDSLPFGLASTEDTKTMWNTSLQPQNCKSYAHKIARVAIVTDEENGKNMFHKTQRERKVWWRKFARYPARFFLSEAKKINKNRETIDIMAQFSFGDVLLETIAYQQDAKKIYPQMDGQENDPQTVSVVEHVASLDWGCLAMICDGFELEDNIGKVKMHAKLSPYKVGLYLEHDEIEDSKSQEKTRLVVYLNNLLKSKGLGTVLTRTKRGVEHFHVPLTINVDDASLQNGIVRVRSQLTTISEAVHITDLPKYVAARCA